MEQKWTRGRARTRVSAIYLAARTSTCKRHAIIWFIFPLLRKSAGNGVGKRFTREKLTAIRVKINNRALFKWLEILIFYWLYLSGEKFWQKYVPVFNIQIPQINKDIFVETLGDLIVQFLSDYHVCFPVCQVIIVEKIYPMSLKLNENICCDYSRQKLVLLRKTSSHDSIS